jgi:FAD/FMN-containing dehydrogenase
MADYHKIAAAKRGAARTTALNNAVDQAMRTIADEMRDNGGIYPHNGGAVGMAELTRRADINESSFYKPQNAELKERATVWLQHLQKKEVIGRKRVRKHLREAVSDWKARFETLDSNNIVSNLKLQEIEAENLKLKAEIESLKAQLRALPSNVKSIRGARR